MKNYLDLSFEDGKRISLMIDDGVDDDGGYMETIKGDAFRPAACMIYYNQMMLAYKEFEENLDISPILRKMKMKKEEKK